MQDLMATASSAGNTSLVSARLLDQSAEYHGILLGLSTDPGSIGHSTGKIEKCH